MRICNSLPYRMSFFFFLSLSWSLLWLSSVKRHTIYMCSHLFIDVSCLTFVGVHQIIHTQVGKFASCKVFWIFSKYPKVLSSSHPNHDQISLSLSQKYLSSVKYVDDKDGKRGKWNYTFKIWVSFFCFISFLFFVDHIVNDKSKIAKRRM